MAARRRGKEHIDINTMSLIKQGFWKRTLRLRFQRRSCLPILLELALQNKLRVAIDAMHGFRRRRIAWGERKRQGAVELDFRPVLGYKSFGRSEANASEMNPQYSRFRADYIHGFGDWVGLGVRFMAYPSAAEKEKARGKLTWLQQLSWPSDFVEASRGAFGYVAGNITFAGKDDRPSFFIQAILIRPEYYRLPNQLRHRYEGWWKRCVAEVEEQCRRLGFERLAIIPSTDPHFGTKGGGKVKPETRKALYKTFPEESGYKMKALQIPTTEGMKEVSYYCKKLG